MKKCKMKIAAFVCLMTAVLFITGCENVSHNAAIIVIGKQLRFGSAQYGDASYLNGLGVVDCSRENSSWEIEIDEEDGISVQDGKVKGVKRIKRTIGKQVTGYLTELAQTCPEAATAYVTGEMTPTDKKEKTEKKSTVAEEKKSVPEPDVTEGRHEACELIPELDFHEKLAALLKEICPEEHNPEDQNPTMWDNLKDYLERMKQLREKKISTTKVRIASYVITEGKLTEIRFVMLNPGFCQDAWKTVDCVGCISLAIDEQ